MSARSLPVILSPEAQDDFEDIRLYSLLEWGAQQEEAYKGALLHALVTIGDNPYIGRPRDELRTGVRSFVVRQHVIFYRITEDAVIVLRIRHGRTDARRALQDEP